MIEHGAIAQARRVCAAPTRAEALLRKTALRALRGLLATATVTALVTPSAVAQRFSLAPTIGVYAPTTDLVSGIVNGGGTVSFKQPIAFTT